MELAHGPAVEEIVCFILCAYGLTQILCFSKVLDRIRPKHYFFSCPMCMGFWVGVYLWSINGLTELFNFDYNFINLLLLGFLSSGSSYILSMIVGDCGLKVEKTNGG